MSTIGAYYLSSKCIITLQNVCNVYCSFCCLLLQNLSQILKYVDQLVSIFVTLKSFEDSKIKTKHHARLLIRPWYINMQINSQWGL